jgi:DNA-binding beta-propeller fold protein YncE
MMRTILGTALALLLAALPAMAQQQAPPQAPPQAPRYEVDAAWPKPLPNRWGLGQVAGVATDAQDHVWIIHRPRTMTEDERGATLSPPRSECCVPAPSVIEFDQEGNVEQAWGGLGHHPSWPDNEHGIYIDPQNFVWIGGNGTNDHVLLKFTRGGQFVLQIGIKGQTGGSNDTQRLGRPAGIEVDAEAHEVYVADGYGNRRVIVFDSDTGAYKRHWGAYGRRPSDDALPAYSPGFPRAQTFRNPVHCVRLARDGLVYVCDRGNDRIQVFRRDGTFVREFVVAPNTLGNGSVWDIALLPDRVQSFLLTADGENNRIRLLHRPNGQELGQFGRNGRNAGQFHWVHNIAADSRGNIYTTEVDTGKRAQRFRLVSPLAQ